MDFSANQSYKSERKSVCLTVCAFFAFVRFVKPYPLSLACVYYITIIAFGNTLKPNCRCSTAAYSDREEYEEWLDFLEKGGTTEEYQKLKTQKPLTNPGKGSRLPVDIQLFAKKLMILKRLFFLQRNMVMLCTKYQQI
ncbi:MAG: hypothetical protein PUB20_01015 [Clostridia bacterium]|nr:hypothetical protein [Clostridia bacterium]